MEKVLCKIILHHKIRYSEAVVYPKVFIDFLDRKLQSVRPEPLKTSFNIDRDMISNEGSIYFLTYELNVLLGI